MGDLDIMTWVKSVEAKTDTNHIKACFREAPGCGGVGGVDFRKIDVVGVQYVDGVFQAVKLCVCEGVFLGDVGGREVCHDAFDIKVLEMFDLLDEGVDVMGL